VHPYLMTTFQSFPWFPAATAARHLRYYSQQQEVQQLVVVLRKVVLGKATLLVLVRFHMDLAQLRPLGSSPPSLLEHLCCHSLLLQRLRTQASPQQWLARSKQPQVRRVRAVRTPVCSRHPLLALHQQQEV
jgi:hypothetical protein